MGPTLGAPGPGPNSHRPAGTFHTDLGIQHEIRILAVSCLPREMLTPTTTVPLAPQTSLHQASTKQAPLPLAATQMQAIITPGLCCFYAL